MKFMAQFEVKRTQEVEEIEKREENGTIVEVKKKVQKEVPVKILIQRPSRSLKGESEFYYASILSDAIQRKGIISRALLEKRIVDDDGILTKAEKEIFSQSNDIIFNKKNELSQLLLVPQLERNKEWEEKVAVCQNEISAAQRILRALYARNQNIFDNTAEEIAQRRTLTWWILNLTHIEENGKIRAFFGDKDLNTKIKEYERIEDEEDVFGMKVYNEAFFYIYLWVTEGITSQEEFDKIQKEMNK